MLNYVFLFFPLSYILLILIATVKSRKKKEINFFYHNCSLISAQKIFNDKLFITRTEGRAYVSTNKNNKNGVDSLSINNYLKNKHMPFYCLKRFTATEPMVDITFSGQTLSLFHPIFNLLKIYHIFNVWGAWKMITEQWVSKSLHDIKIISCTTNGSSEFEITQAEVMLKKGWGLFSALARAAGMVILNLVISATWCSLGLLALPINYHWITFELLHILFICVSVVVLWFAIKTISDLPKDLFK
ncbi:hypothetical protein ACWERB_001943 [Enterobacter hormaechei]